jgi:hypothetical protein
MTMRRRPFSPRTWTPTGLELGHSPEVREGTVRLPRGQLPEELRQHGELMLAVVDLPDANRRILGVEDSGVNLPAATVSPSDWSRLVPPGTGESLRPVLRVGPLSLPERTRRLAGLPGAIVIAAVLSAVLTAIPLLLPAPDAAAERAQAALVEAGDVSAALTALGGHGRRRLGGAAGRHRRRRRRQGPCPPASPSPPGAPACSGGPSRRRRRRRGATGSGSPPGS